MNDMANARKRWPKWLLWLGLVLVGGAGCALFVDHPPYPLTFNIEWDEEVQVDDKQVIWVHRTEVYQRRSSLSRWDARKVAEELSFTPSERIGKLSYRIELGGFGGIERMEDDWVIGYSGSSPKYLQLGSCQVGSGGGCVVVVRADGAIYKPKNSSEIENNFQPLLTCRTDIADCFRRFNERQVTIEAKQKYKDSYPTFADTYGQPTGKRFEPSELRP